MAWLVIVTAFLCVWPAVRAAHSEHAEDEWWRLAHSVPPKEYCKPDDATCWPSASDVSTLVSDLGNEARLIQKDGNGYDAFQTINWNGRFRKRPSFIAVVTTVASIQRCVQFVKEHNIQLTIVSSGHSFIGRNTEDNSFQINVHEMTDASIDLSCGENPTSGCITAQAGCSWGQLYNMTDGVGRLVVGGSQPTVSISGYTLGGGHSPYSRLFGIGVDNVIEISLVGPDASRVTATSTSYSKTFQNGTEVTVADGDLFWSLRGGGSTFGVISHMKFKLHIPPAGGVVQMVCLFPAYLSSFAYFEHVLKWFPETAAGFPNSVGGYLIGGATYQQGGGILSLVHTGGWSDAMEAFEPVEQKMVVGVYNPCGYTNYSTFWEYERNVSDVGNGSSLFIANNLIQAAQLGESGLFGVALYASFKDAYDTKLGGDFSFTFALIGGVSANISATTSAVHPGFRTGLFSLTHGTSYTGSGGNYNRPAERIMKLQHNLRPFSSGEYFNENKENSTTWRDDYFSDFARLETFKKAWDTENVFFCKQCVGAVDVPLNGATSGACSRPDTGIGIIFLFASAVFGYSI